jgi:hypothetical protein
MKQKRSLAPLGLMVFGGLLVVVALAILVALPSSSPDVVPTATPKEAVDIPAEDNILRVSVGDAKAAFDLKQAVFVDVRDRISYDLNHIPGALAISYDELEDRLDELHPADWIITYCT